MLFCHICYFLLFIYDDADVSLPPAHFNKHNVPLMKLGTNDAKMPSWRYCFPPRALLLLAVLALKKQKCYWIVGVRNNYFSLIIIDNNISIRSFANRENNAFYDYSWNKFHSNTSIQQLSSTSSSPSRFQWNKEYLDATK